MSLNKLQEALPVILNKGKGGWKLTWSRSGDNGYDKLMYRNEVLNILVVIEELDMNNIQVEIFKDGVVIDKQNFTDYMSANTFLKNYFIKNSSTESLLTIWRYKESLKEATDRGINHEYRLIENATKEYIRVLNMLINNENISPEVILKLKEVRQEILSRKLI